MATSLAQQLQRLAVPQTSNLKRDKKRASLLFDPKEAATLTKEVVYQIGLDGFHELKSKHPSFYFFENTLFHITSKEFERSVQTAEANEKLNRNIKKFIQVASPYFLLSCTHKCLEWLIYRYYIHDYNKNDLMMLILPYHETNIFVRVLQLIKISDNDLWSWLKPLQKPGIHLPKKTLYNHAANNPRFLQFLSDNLLSTIKEHEDATSLTVLFNFYSVTFVGAIEHSPEINEGHVSQMLPSLLKGLKSEIQDYCAAAYLIASRLLAKTRLSDKILKKLVEKISLIKIRTLGSEALFNLLVLYQTQQQYTEMSKVAVQNLANKNWVPEALQKISNDGFLITSVIRPVLKGVLHLGIHDEEPSIYRSFMEALLKDLMLDEGNVCDIINITLDEYGSKQEFPEETNQWVKHVFDRVEQLNPTSFDAEISKIMKDSNMENQHQRKAFRRIIATSESPKSAGTQYAIFQKLYHPAPEIRSTAIKLLMKQYNKLKDREQEFIKNALIDRLGDDDTKVVFETLQQTRGILLDVIDTSEIKPILINILRKCRQESNYHLAKSALKLLCSIDSGDDLHVLLAVLPFLLPVHDKAIPVAQTVLNCDYGKTNVLKRINLDDSDIFKSVWHLILNNDLDRGELLKLVGVIPPNDTVSRYLLLVLICNAKGGSNVDAIKVVIECLKIKLVKGEASDLDNLTFAYKKRLPLQGILTCVQALIQNVNKLNGNLGTTDFFVSSDTSDFIILTLDFLLKGVFDSSLGVSTEYADTLRVFFNRFCVDLSDKIMFLLNVLVTRSSLVGPVLQLRAVRTVNAILNESNDAFVPYLLVGLNSEYAEIRRVVIASISSILLKQQGIFSGLLKGLVINSEELLMDCEQVPLIVYNILSKKDKACAAVLQNLLHLINQNIPMYLKAGIVKALSLIKTTEVLTGISKLSCTILDDANFNPINSDILSGFIAQFDENFAKLLKQNSPMWDFVQKSLSDDKSNEKHFCPSILLMNRFDSDLYDYLSVEMRKAILSIMIKMATFSANTDLLPAASRVFKHIDLDVVSIQEHLDKMRDVQSPKVEASKRLKRMSVIPTSDILDTREWMQGVTVLEFIQNKKKIRNVNKLLKVLFEILKRCLDFDEQSSVEYPKQLVLTAILHYCDKIDEATISKSVFNMELIVQCIRASQNPQTHHHALLLLSRVALLVPEQVLHHIMAIFTFMGSSVLRHDDAYSFQIINKIIETVIPILVKDGKTESRVSVLRVFVDVILDVPEHRRMPLYKKLLEEIDPVNNLYIFLLLIFEAHIIHPSVEKQGNVNLKVDKVPKRLDIAAELCSEFTPQEIISTCISLMEYLKALPENNNDRSSTASLIFNIDQHTPKQFRHYKYTLVTFTSNLLASKQVVSQIAQLSDDESLKMEKLFKNMIIHILTYIQTTTKISEKNINTPQAQYWKVMLHHSYDVLDSLNALLTSQMFLLVIKGLMSHNLNTVKRRALELLNSKLQYDSDFFKDSNESEVYDLLPPLIAIIESTDSKSLNADEEVVIQTALLSLKLFVKMLAPSNPEKFDKILLFITGIVKSKNLDTNITASAILCLSELCTNLRAHSIPCLNEFMHVLIKVLKKQKKEEHPSLLLLSTITALLKIFDCLSLFISPYLEKLLTVLSSLSTIWSSDSTDPKLSPFLSKLNSVKQKIGANIPLRVLIPSVTNCFNELIEKKKYTSVRWLMDILAESLTNVNPVDLQSNLPDLSSLFLNALQFRSNNIDEFADCNEVESHIIKALTSLILKLSETSFRPLYYKLYDWAIRSQAKNERAITFYALSSKISGSLKGLFVLFAGQFIQNASNILDSCNTLKNTDSYFDDDDKTILLLENVLRTLNNVCMYDSQKFINKERFDVLMQPLVDQLENTLGDYKTRAKELVIPCIVNFTVAIADDALWKQMNYQILLKMRDSNVSIRLIGLECLREVAKKLGEDFLPLLPETIPFLAELLEDAEESVEKACQKAVQELEKVLGEPLQKYF